MTENTLGSGCSGYGGLELGIAQVIPNITTRWVADYEPPTPKKPNPKQTAATILRHRFPGAPNLGDITIVDWATTAPVKIVCAGTPCQDVSAAGARAGMRAGTRSGIWSSMVEAIAHHRPTLVVWENVRGALSATADSNVEPCPICLGDDRECTLRALGRVLGDLSELGYDACWEVVAASDIGAPHRRERVFVIAWPAAVAGGGGRDPGDQPRPPGQTGIERADPAGGSWSDPADTSGTRLERPRPGGHGPEIAQSVRDAGPAAHPESDGRNEGRTEPEGQLGRPDAAERSNGTAADTDGHGRESVLDGIRGRQPDPARRSDVDWGPFAAAVRRWELVLGRPAPAPTGPTTRGGQALAPAFVEWLMGLDQGWVTNVPGLTRNEQLHALGNGVVPQQAAHALRRLLPHAPEWVRADLGLCTDRG